jgi:hypothetical protein
LSKRFILMALVLAACVIGVAGAGAANNTVYPDPAGDAGPGNASPDVTQVEVSNDFDGNITLVITYGNRSTLGSGDFITIFLETDRNPATGRNGLDYAIGLSPSDAFMARGTASGFEPAPQSTLRVSADRRTITVNRSELGATTGFIFFMFTDVNDAPGDEVPDGDAVFAYNLKLTPVLESIVAVFAPKAPRAGAVFRVARAQLRLDEGEMVTPDRITCTATLAGKRLKGTACRWKLSRTAKKKRLVVRITATYKGVAETFLPYSFKVK